MHALEAPQSQGQAAVFPWPPLVGLGAVGLVFAAACLLLAACGQQQIDSPETPPISRQAGTPSAPPSPRGEATPAPALGDVIWASSADPVTNAPQNEVAVFSPDAPRIAAFVLASALSAGSTIHADWEYNDTTLDAFTRQIVTPTAIDRTWLSFHIDRVDAESWPAGTYEVTISLNGQPTRRASIAVSPPA